MHVSFPANSASQGKASHVVLPLAYHQHSLLYENSCMG